MSKRIPKRVPEVPVEPEDTIPIDGRAAFEAAQSMYEMLAEAGHPDIEHLDPKSYAARMQAPIHGEAGQNPVLAALDRFILMLNHQQALLDRFEAAVRQLERQLVRPSRQGPAVPGSVMQTSPQQDVGAIWARGLKERVPGSE